MKLTVQDHQGCRVVRVREARIDAAMATQFREAARHAFLDGPPVAILDLEGVGFMDSSGLGAVIGLHRLLAPGIVVHLAALQPRVAKVFALTRMDLLFSIHPDADAALAGARIGHAA